MGVTCRWTPEHGDFPLGLRERVEAHEPRAGLSNALERIYSVELRIVDRCVVWGAESRAQTSVLVNTVGFMASTGEAGR